jgi:hypothetical protein
MRTMLLGGLVAAALMSVGCGGTLEPEDTLDLESQKAPLPDCNNSPDNLRNYYSDATHTTLVGQWGCWCSGLYYWGTGTQYVEYIWSC